jgi:hypothetical protein
MARARLRHDGSEWSLKNDDQVLQLFEKSCTKNFGNYILG